MAISLRWPTTRTQVSGQSNSYTHVDMTKWPANSDTIFCTLYMHDVCSELISCWTDIVSEFQLCMVTK